MAIASEKPAHRDAVKAMAADLLRASQQVRGSDKRPATREEALARAIAVANRRDHSSR